MNDMSFLNNKDNNNYLMVGIANFRSTNYFISQKTTSPVVPTIDMSTEIEINLSKITLRPYKISDVDDFLLYGGNEKVTRFTRWNTFTTKQEAVSYIRDYCIPHPYCRSICIDDRSIGFVIIMPRSGDDRCRVDVGYALAAEYWGHGITTRAVKMAISDGLKEFPDVVRLQALVELENKASQRVLDKLGFLKEGVLRKYSFNKGDTRDMVIYSLLSTDFMP
jgi:RimJ/RimL family protein N-acetyltransferase